MESLLRLLLLAAITSSGVADHGIAARIAFTLALTPAVSTTWLGKTYCSKWSLVVTPKRIKQWCKETSSRLLFLATKFGTLTVMLYPSAARRMYSVEVEFHLVVSLRLLVSTTNRCLSPVALKTNGSLGINRTCVNICLGRPLTTKLPVRGDAQSLVLQNCGTSLKTPISSGVSNRVVPRLTTRVLSTKTLSSYSGKGFFEVCSNTSPSTRSSDHNMRPRPQPSLLILTIKTTALPAHLPLQA